MRLGLLIALGLVVVAGFGLGAHLIARDTGAPPPSGIEAGQPKVRTRTKTHPARTLRSRTVASPAIVEDAHRGRGREGIEEAEVDSHGDESGSSSGR